MCLSKIYSVVLICLFSGILFSQTYFDLKIGSAFNFGHTARRPIGEYTAQNHDRPTLFIHYISCYSTFRSKTVKCIEFQMGLSFLQYKQDLQYYKKDEPKTTQRSISIGGGKMVSSFLRYEFTPTFRIRNTKICLGILNLDLITVNANKLRVTKTNYDIIKSLYQREFDQYYGTGGFKDSIVSFNSSEDLVLSFNMKKAIRLSFYFGIEQEVIIKKQSYLFGAKISYSNHKDYWRVPDLTNYYLFVVYAGIRFPNENKKHVPVEDSPVKK